MVARRRSHAAHVLCACLVLSACLSHEPPPAAATTAVAPCGETTAQALALSQGGAARSAIIEFDIDVTQAGGPRYVAPEACLAVFGDDSTLWRELPLPVQVLFMIDQLKAAAPQHPEAKRNPVFKAPMAHNTAVLMKTRRRCCNCWTAPTAA